MSSLKDRTAKDFTNLEGLERQALKYLMLKDHRRKLEEELRATKSAIRRLRKEENLMSAIGVLERLEKKRASKEEVDDSGDEEESPMKTSDGAVIERPMTPAGGEGSESDSLSSAKIPKKRQRTLVQERLAQKMSASEEKKGQVSRDKDRVQPPRRKRGLGPR